MLPAVSLGCWHNFGAAGTDASKHTDESAMHDNARAMLRTAFDLGITHFDLANNYGPPPGAAEVRVGRILKQDFAAHRDELIISSKAGYRMWPGPYGEMGSRKYLLASLDASLARLGLDYIDIFYSHRFDPVTPMEETLGALDQAVKSGKAIYAGISSYPPKKTRKAAKIAERERLATPIIHQPSYSMLGRGPEDGLIDACDDLGMGMIVFCPLAQGLLTSKYLHGVPDDSRAKQESGFLSEDRVTPELQAKLIKLNALAQTRGQSLAQLALAWVLRHDAVTSALIGASRPEQIAECCKCLDAGPITADQLGEIDSILKS